VVLVADRLAGEPRLPERCRVVVVARSGLGAHVEMARRIGATGVVAWDDDPTKLLEAVDRASRGQSLPLPTTAPGQVDDPLATLTARERDILALASLGCRNQDIAGALGISTHTVRTHMQNLLGKLGVAHRHAASAQALRSPLLRDSVDRWARQLRTREDPSLCAS
jgi:DNA-binding NarL/FixJ family response regulator